MPNIGLKSSLLPNMPVISNGASLWIFKVSKLDQFAQRIKPDNRNLSVASHVPVNITVSGVLRLAVEPTVMLSKPPNAAVAVCNN